jgi:hypothetical protein
MALNLYGENGFTYLLFSALDGISQAIPKILFPKLRSFRCSVSPQMAHRLR